MKITLQDLHKAFGANKDFPKSTQELYYAHNFSYQEMNKSEIAEIMKEIDKSIAKGFTQVGSHRADIWESAWSDVKQNFTKSKFNPLSLNPNFISKHDCLRWDGKYIRPDDSRMELSFFEVFRDWLFIEYLTEIDNVYEFGSGSGYNLIEGTRKFPGKQLLGLDWSDSAVEILNIYAISTGAKVRGSKFDFFNPNQNLEIPKNTAFLTFCAFEQIGTKYEAMLDYFIAKCPTLIIQMEPTIEFYDIKNPFDQAAIKYHQHRHYLQGYFKMLRELANAGKIEIITSKRLGFGSKYNECYSFHVWRPI